MRNMDTITKTPMGVNCDIVESVVECAGYRTRIWVPVVAFAAVNSMLTGVLLWPMVGWLASVAAWMLGGCVVFWLLATVQDWESQTLSMRNALERRFGLPEYRRHRHDYSPFWDGE